MQHDYDFDVSRIDHRSLSPSEWTALKAEIFRRARLQRGEVICSGIARAWCGFRRLLKWSALRGAWISLVRYHHERWQRHNTAP
jgi:predicted metal-binding transcription factor (methanogenesis marker protein 9)